MLGWLGGLFGLFNANPTASSLAKDVSRGVDMLVYTDEEKAIASKEAFASWLRMVELMKDTESYRSITRRILAVTIIMNLLLMIWICIVAEASAFFGWMASPVGQPFTPITMSILQIAGVFQLGWVFCTIIVFYFGPHLIQFLSKGK